jgi:hypothetical protein
MGHCVNYNYYARQYDDEYRLPQINHPESEAKEP